jgi:hypothetical protein
MSFNQNVILKFLLKKKKKKKELDEALKVDTVIENINMFRGD